MGRAAASRSPGASCSSTPPAPAFRSCASSPASGRVVLTATDAAAQQFETVFPRVLRQGVRRPGGRSRQERPRLDLGGVHLRQRRRAAVVRAERPAADRAAAARRHRRRRRPRSAESRAGRRAGAVTYLEPDAGRRRRHRARRPDARGAPSSRAQLEALKAARKSMPPDQYDAELEKLLVEIARIGVRSARSRRSSCRRSRLSASSQFLVPEPRQLQTTLPTDRALRFLNTNTPTMPTTKPATCAAKATPPPLRARRHRDRAGAEQLHQEPEAEQDDRRQLDDLAEDDRAGSASARAIAGRARSTRPSRRRSRRSRRSSAASSADRPRPGRAPRRCRTADRRR